MTLRIGAILLALAACAASATAQGDDARRVAVQVTGVAGRSVFLDRGRGAGLEPGMNVRITPPGELPVDIVVRVVSTNSARADLPPDAEVPPVGTPGEFFRKPERSASDETAKPQRADRVYDDLPWSATDEEFDPSGPLLAPVQGTPAERRPTDWRGRLFSSLVGSRDSSGAESNDWFIGRLGARVAATNLFGAAGEVELAFDLDRRGTDLASTGEESDTRGRLERASYTYGDQAARPYRVQLGRFISRFVPEVGLVDGVEGVLRARDGVAVGAFVGALPRPFPSHDTGDDLATHVFVDLQSDGDAKVAANFAFQKSWHRGTADRDLFLTRLSATPTESVSLWWATKIDLYTSGDRIKGSGLDLTESFATLRYAPKSGHGIALSHSHFEWAETDRREYQDLPVELIERGRVDRVSASGWLRPHDAVRLRGRADYWSDEDEDGTTWEFGAELDGVVEERTWLAASVFRLDGSTSEGLGMRVDARRRWEEFGVRVGYTMRDIDQELTLVGEDSFTSESLRFGADWYSGNWQFDLTGDFWFGDREDAFSIGLFAQYVF